LGEKFRFKNSDEILDTVTLKKPSRNMSVDRDIPSVAIKITPPLYDELRTRGIGLLMKMSSVGKSNRGTKPTSTENG
jgi:hypothetical protein